MSKNFLLKNATVVQLDPPKVEEADLRIADGRIMERERNLQPRAVDRTLNLENKVVLPGLVCAHHHLYSSLARGMPMPVEPPRSFLEILEKVWWKLDRALDEESIYYSALVGCIEALQSGTTTVLDHHASPGWIRGSLQVIKQAVKEVGIRAVLCYEVTDRGGEKERELGLQENEEFLQKGRDSMVRGMVGAHASFTLGPQALSECAALAKSYACGVHAHLGEARLDADDARAKYGRGLVERLAEVGLLSFRSVFAHGTHLEEGELQAVRAARSWLVHNPRSNMHNRVGHARVLDFGSSGALGTDGISGDMFEEMKAAFFKARDAGLELSAEDCVRLEASSQKLASDLFQRPLADLEIGAAADLVILDYHPPTPLLSENLGWHLLFGMKSSHVESVMVEGRMILDHRHLPHLDVKKTYGKARLAAERLWRRL
ncbi:MAG: putative aminohydrolase SsnA [Acidobacteria bacterium]|nr:putative aminohydrolase SsnA [Acidobacteriota bacterium]